MKTNKYTKENDNLNIRMYLVNARQKKGYSQRKTAQEAGLSAQHYCRIENGERGKKISFLTIGRIAKVLEIPLDEYYRYERSYIDRIEFENERNY